MAMATRYYTEDDEIGITPSRLKRIGKARQLEYLLAWFHRHYEDPAQETPYNSEEGGYLYIWGGPYDAREELDAEFGSFVSEQVIEEAVQDIESDGLTDWAPGLNHADHERARDDWQAEQLERDDERLTLDLGAIIAMLEDGQKPRYGDADEKRQREETLDSLEALESLLPKSAHAGIGHNNPPTEGGADVDVIANIREASAVIRDELGKSEPNALDIAKATSHLSSMLSWFGKKLDIAIESFAKEVGGSSGKAVGVVLGAYGIEKFVPAIGTALGHVIDKATQWLTHITLPF